ncbi:hypothetical protein [Rhodococcus sp. NPDC059234]|uniref:hypothetical protein n=1 Tax=Rhodococcus sp. NPDC059234 TaxID=3346781 RepID=UPI00366E3499
MLCVSVDADDLRWDRLEEWILAWDPCVDLHEALPEWGAGLSRAASAVDSRILWCPELNVVTAPAELGGDEIEVVLRSAIRRYANIDTAR